MAQGEFTQEEAQMVLDAVNDMFEAIPKSKRVQFLGHLNDISLFLEAAKSKAPNEKESKGGHTS